MSFLANISPGNVKGKLPVTNKYTNDISWTRPTQWIDLGLSSYDSPPDLVPEKIIGLSAVIPEDTGHNFVALHIDTNDSSHILVNWGDGNPAETEHESDFSSDVNGYAISSHGSVSRVATHNGKSDVLLYQSSDGRDGIKNESVDLLTGNAYTLTFDYYADASFSGVWGVEGAFANRISIASNFPTIVTGAWTSVSLTIPATRPSTSSIERLEIRPQADANSVYGNTQTGDQIGFKNIKVIRNASSSGYYVKHNQNFSHSYDYDAITTDTSTAKATLYNGYKQAKFEITPIGTAKFSQISVDVNGPHSTYSNRLYKRGPNILDIFVSSSLATNVEVSDDRPLTICEQIEIRNTSSNRLTNPQRLYSGAKNLQSIPFVPFIYNTGTRDYYGTFYACHKLAKIPDGFADPDKYWFKNPSRTQQAFYACYRLVHLPNGLFGTTEWASCSNFHRMFEECRSLRHIPHLPVRTGSGTDTRLDYVFNNCIDLKAVPQGFSIQRANNEGVDRLFHGCQDITDFSALMDDSPHDIFANMNNPGPPNFNMQASQMFSHNRTLTEFPFIGQFTKFNNELYHFIGGCNFIKNFNSQYTHLDFTQVDGLKQCFQDCYCMEEYPEIKVRSLTRNNAFHYTFYNNFNLRKVKITGMIAGPANGEYQRCFYNNRTLAVIDGVDFSFATETSDYYQMFHVARDITAIRFPGTFRTGYASPRINVAVAEISSMDGEYQITEAGTRAEIGVPYYTQVGGNGQLQVVGPFANEIFGDMYQWVLSDSTDSNPTITSALGVASTLYTPWVSSIW